LDGTVLCNLKSKNRDAILVQIRIVELSIISIVDKFFNQNLLQFEQNSCTYQGAPRYSLAIDLKFHHQTL
jgi:hypothetical protein